MANPNDTTRTGQQDDQKRSGEAPPAKGPERGDPNRPGAKEQK